MNWANGKSILTWANSQAGLAWFGSGSEEPGDLCGMQIQYLDSGIGLWVFVAIIWAGVLIMLKIYLDGRRNNGKRK